jgi:predicted SprT family Zn-dependent metalloprotease
VNINAAREMAKALMIAHGLRDWRFEFDRAARRFGSCCYARKTITLSWKLTLLNDVDQVKHTILHEIAHAFTPGDGHGAAWKRECARLGISADRCFSAADVNMPAKRVSRFEIGCLQCGWWQDRHRVTQTRLICRTCRDVLAYRQRADGRRFVIERAGRRGTVRWLDPEPV